MRRKAAAFAFSGSACLTVAALTACTTPEPVDLVLHSGTVLALDEAGTTGTAIAIRDGKVLAVGGDELTGRYAAERSVDLGGRTAMPGFNDAHIHIRGRARRHIPLGGISSIEELQDLVAAKADELGPGNGSPATAGPRTKSGSSGGRSGPTSTPPPRRTRSS